MNKSDIAIWKEKVTIPTYGIGQPDKNPMFFEKRVYQGSSGVVYPNPVIEKIFDEKQDKEYIALFLENKYLKVMILPELGGRIQMAYDKIKQRHFVYYNQVIKPALVGLTGPWISGGIEFNWPQHHRPSTFEPVDYLLEEHADGSKTVWVNEVERMFHTKGMAGFTLYPDKAYIEIKAKLYNRTGLPQTFLWWANPAVKVNDHYQSVFPPDVNAVFDHGKRDVSTFPIATGTYYKVDYSPGTDISMYKNIPVPTSYMAINSDYNFVGGYEHDSQAGLLHVADHHVSPGKKQWTWGHSDFGQAWDRNLTDEDGPYIELMTGMFTDNQPDFTWLMPYEEKSFTQYFLPYHSLGLVKNATKDILVSIFTDNGNLTLKVYATGVQENISVDLSYNGESIFNIKTSIDPEKVFEHFLTVDSLINENQLLLIIRSSSGKELIRYEPALNKNNKIPQPASPALQPEDIANNEQLFLTGQHLEQYRHATCSPVPYYEEALRRDAEDIRNNNALGVWYLRRGKFKVAEQYLRKAVETITRRNPNPYDSEAYYNLGLCLKYLNRIDEAYNAFYKSTWSNAWKDSGYFSVAQIDVLREDYEQGLDHINQSLDRNGNNGKAYVIKSAIQRKLGHPDTAMETCSAALERDNFNLGALFEMKYASEAAGVPGNTGYIIQLLELSRGQDQTLIEYALDYKAAGLYTEAAELLKLISKQKDISPMVYYTLAWLDDKNDNWKQAIQWLQQANAASSYLCFPNRLEEIAILEHALLLSPSDAKAAYYLGNLFYDKRQYEDAIRYWEQSARLDDSFPTVLRNLGIAYFNKQNNAEQALAYYEKAFALDKTDDRILMELDQLYKRLNKDLRFRLKFIEEHLETAMQRDDVYLERVTLYNLTGRYEKAFELIMNRQFHPWEGGEGKVSGQYVYSLIKMAFIHIDEGKYKEAVELLDNAQVYPFNLGEGKLYGTQENDIFYWLGCAYEGIGQTETARQYYQKAVMGLDEPSAAVFYNDQQPDKIFYQGLAWNKLGQPEKAIKIFEKLIAYTDSHQNDEIKIDYFAVSLPDLLIFEDDLQIRHKIHTDFIKGLGFFGLKRWTEARQLFEKILESDAGHSGSRNHLEWLQSNTYVD